MHHGNTTVGTRLVVILVVGAIGATACGGSDAGPTTTTAPSVVTAATTTEPPDATEPPTTTAPPANTPVVVDTDMGVEGTLSILYLLGRPDIDVRAITISGTGLVHCEPGVQQALALVALTAGHDIPVACGSEQPLADTHSFPSSWRAVADAGYGLDLPEGGASSDLPAPELLVSAISSAEEPVVVYTDGPLTNLASALRLDPGIVEGIGAVYSKAGTLDATGNIIRAPQAEYNIWVDPVAAAEVLGSGLPLTLVPLDATNQVPLHIFHLRALEEHQSTPEAAAAVAILANDDELVGGGLYFSDQLAAALAVDESLARYETMHLTIVTEGADFETGQVDRAEQGNEVRVATVIDRERVEREFLSSLAGEDVGPIVVDPDFTVEFDGEAWTVDCPPTMPTGDYVVSFTNRSGGEAGVVFGRLTEDGTEAELLAWTALNQPPFYIIDGTAFADPGVTAIAVVTLDEPGTNYLEGLHQDGMDRGAETIGQIEITG